MSASNAQTTITPGWNSPASTVTRIATSAAGPRVYRDATRSWLKHDR